MFVAVFLYLISCGYSILGQDFAVKGQDFAVKGQDFRVFSVEC